jgi:hypothetical protein
MYESHLFMSSVFIRKDGGVILGIFLEKQEKVSRVQDGCPIKMSGMTEVGNDAQDTMSDMKRKRDPGQESSTAFQNLLTKFPLRLPTTLLNSGHRFHLHAGKSDRHDWRF